MRTMASVWFSVIVLISIQKVFGNVCLRDNNDFSCNECIRCGGDWCNERGAPHCIFSLEDGWCPEQRELLPEIEEINTPGVAVSPSYAQRTLYVEKPNRLDIKYTAAKTKHKATMIILNSTQNFNIEIKEYETKCSGENCTTTIEATPLRSFCSTIGKTSEFVYVRINVGLSEEVMVKYHVSCACECSQKVDKNSMYCNKHGNLSCGVCSCYSGWTGEFCNKPVCAEKRGDVQCTNPARNDVECSGNGYCGPCETCICYNDREGSQYFDQENYCADLCMVASDCEDCLLNNTVGECDSCIHSMTVQRYNKSVTNIRDEYNRTLWVPCNETIYDCFISYFAKRTEDGEIYVMVERSCNDVDVAAVVGGPKVPIILGVLGIVAAVAAVGGVMLWKHLNTVPPVPLNDPQYQNIDAEDCTGENPLYKPPTSSFKNPTYGKW